MNSFRRDAKFVAIIILLIQGLVDIIAGIIDELIP